MKTVAAIDIGSNSVHLAVAKINSLGQLTILDSHKEVVRLGRSVQQTGSLEPASVKDLIKALNAMREIAAAYNATIRACGTYALREAKNHEDVLDTIEQQTGIRIQLLDGEEEARLSLLGARCGLSLDKQVVLCVDVGGGSTEIVIAREDKVAFVTSMKFGAVTKNEEYFTNGDYTELAILRLKAKIASHLEPMLGEIRKHPFTVAVASSGTAKALAGMAFAPQGEAPPTNVNGLRCSVADSLLIEERLLRLGSPAKIKTQFRIDPKRAEIVLAGTCILNEVARLLGIKEWLISGYGLREGLAMDSFSRSHAMRVSFADIRWRSVVSIAEKFDVERHYARQVRRLTLSVYRQLESTFFGGQSEAQRQSNTQLLPVAAYLAEVGKYVGFSQYHQHSAYLLSQGSLMGFSQEEKHLISYIVRFSRKRCAGTPEDKKLESMRGNTERINILASCLRIATALNRTRRFLVSAVDLRFTHDRLVLCIYHRPGAKIDAEQEAMDRELKPVSKIFGLSLSCEWLPR